MIDYIVVGFGLAGLSFVEQLEKEGKSYMVYENYSQQSSRVAGGIYNPVILKRFTMAWKGNEQVETAISFYKGIENKLGGSYVSELPVLRRFNSIEEQNTWFEACDKPGLDKLLYAKLVANIYSALDVPFQYGKVLNTGRIFIKRMLSSYITYLEQKSSITQESFEHGKLNIGVDGIKYKDIKARNIIFAEGFGLKNNPYFKHLPLEGNKGEYIVIKCQGLKLKEAVKSSVFIIPLGEDLYKVGATYNNHDKSGDTTLLAREELIQKLNKILKVAYQIVGQETGIRPTVRDRKPLVGTHPTHENLHLLNGLGSRGILIGPTVAKELYNHIEHSVTLDSDINLNRFLPI